MPQRETIKTEPVYLTIEPMWRGSKLIGARIERLTKNRPKGGVPGAAVVKLSIQVPSRVFIPFEVEADLEATEGEMGVVKVVVEPFEEEDGAVLS